MVNYIAQAVGFGGAALNCISFQQNKRSRIIGVQIFAAIMFIIHFIMLGAYSGAALNFIGLLRSIVFYNSDKKWAKSPVWLVVFIIISAVSATETLVPPVCTVQINGGFILSVLSAITSFFYTFFNFILSIFA